MLALRQNSFAESFFFDISWEAHQTNSTIPKCVGWEHLNGTLTFKQVDLKSMFDPLKYILMYNSLCFLYKERTNKI